MKKLFLLCSLFLLFSIGLKAQPIQGEILADSGNLKVVRVWGTHYERGYAYGYLCEPNIMAIWEDYIVPNYSTVLPFARILIGNPSNFSIDSIYIREAQGILDGLGAAGADTAGLSYLDIFVVNFMTDLEGFMPKAGFMTHQCSSMMNWGTSTLASDLSGKSVIAHHLDAVGYDSIVAHNQVMVVHIPSEANEQAWLLTGIAGQMVASQAVNESGIAAFLNTVNGFSAQTGQGYEPMTITLRKSIERLDYNGDGLHNTNDVRAAIQSNTKYSRGFIVCALAPSTCIEDTLISMVAELASVAPFITFRHINDVDSIVGDNLYAANDMIKRNNAQQYCSRYLQVKAAINGDYAGVGIGAQDNWDIMHDHSTQTSNLQFIQVIPELNRFSISVSDNAQPGYLFAPQVFDMLQLFDHTAGMPQVGESNSAMHLYPNPVTSSLSVSIPDQQGRMKCYLSDIEGRVLNVVDIDNYSTIDVSGLSSGLYFLHVSSSNGSFSGRFVKE